MTILQGLQVKQSTIRESICALLALETRTEEQDGELVKLTAEGQKIEPGIRAALIAEPDPTEVLVEGDAESRELRQLTGRANAGAIILAVTEKRNSIGAELELQQHHKLAENQIPLDPCFSDAGAEGRRRDHGTDERRDQPSGDRATRVCEWRRRLLGYRPADRGPR